MASGPIIFIDFTSSWCLEPVGGPVTDTVSTDMYVPGSLDAMSTDKKVSYIKDNEVHALHWVSVSETTEESEYIYKVLHFQIF